MNIKKIGINRADEEDLDHRTEKHVWKIRPRMSIRVTDKFEK